MTDAVLQDAVGEAEDLYLSTYRALASERVLCCQGPIAGGGCPRQDQMLSWADLDLDHAANVGDSCVEWARARRAQTGDLDAPWNTGLAEGGTPILHRLFAIDSHPQWGGGMTLRCSVRSCRPGERACHSRTSHAFEQPAMDAALSLIADMMQEMREGAMDAS